MLNILRNALNPASYPTLKDEDAKDVVQTSEPRDPRAPVSQPAAQPTPAAK